MPSDPELTGQSRKRGLPKHSQHYTRPCQALVPATGPQESAAVSARSERPISYAIAAVLLQRKSVASTHMRWSTTPNLRASATLARFMPRRFATLSAQCFRLEKRVARVSMMCAACVHNAHATLFQRDIDSRIVFHGCSFYDAWSRSLGLRFNTIILRDSHQPGYAREGRPITASR